MRDAPVRSRDDGFTHLGSYAMAPDETHVILQALATGDPSAHDRLFPLVYDELRRIAAKQMQQERADHTLQPTALAHEAYLKLVDQTQARFNDRSHFLAVASQAIRRILVDSARAHQRQKRGGGWNRADLDDVDVVHEDADELDLVALDQALTALADDAPDNARTVELRFFGGMTVEEIAEVMGVSTRTVERRWVHARAWLFRAMNGGQS